MWRHNIPWSNNYLYNHKQWNVCYTKNLNNSHYSKRFRREVIIYANNAVVYNPDTEGLIQGTLSQLLARGASTTKFMWPAGDAPANTTIATSISNYKTYLNQCQSNGLFGNSMSVSITDETANSVTVELSITNHNDQSYRSADSMYVPDCKKTYTTFANNAGYVCIMNLNGTKEYFKAKQTFYTEGQQRTFKKFDNECYIVFSSNVVTSDNKTLIENRMYKMANSEITATPSANGIAFYHHGQPD